jgi:geranylgeranylglycerol-phosphate geranylgeranyltransferase
MVTGELNPAAALTLSGVLLTLCGLVTWYYLQPAALLFLFGGVLLNILYEYAKGYGILGNIVFGLMITMAPLFGGYASGPTASTVLKPHRLSVLVMVWATNALMTYYTYFKDYQGDRRAGKRTLVVAMGIRKSRVLALISAFFPTIIFLTLRVTHLHTTPLNTTFHILALLTLVIQVQTGILYFQSPSGTKTYNSLKTNFRACTCAQAALIAIFNPELAMWLFIFSYIFVGMLFEMHGNPKQ